MTQDEKKYQKFLLWMSQQKNRPMTKSEEVFVKKMFEFFEDYPSFMKMIPPISSDLFYKIQKYLREP